MTPPSHHVQIDLPNTPVAQKIRRIIRQEKYQSVEKAGALARALALATIGPDVLVRSGLQEDGAHGTFLPLDEAKMQQIQAIIQRVYKGKANWKQCRISIGKKYQQLRRDQRT